MPGEPAGTWIGGTPWGCSVVEGFGADIPDAEPPDDDVALKLGIDAPGLRSAATEEFLA